MDVGIIHIISIAAIAQILLFAFFLVNHRKIFSNSNKILTCLLLTYAILIICSILLSSKSFMGYYRYAYLGNQLAFLIGPLLYFYVKSILDENFSFRKKHIVHFVLPVLAVVYLIFKFYMIKINITCRSNEIFLGSVLFIQTMAYIIATYMMYTSHESNFNFQIDSTKAKWLKFLIFGCMSIWLCKLLFFIIWDAGGFYDFCPNTLKLYFFSSFLFFNTIIYNALKKPEIFSNGKKYANSILNDTNKQQFKKKLIHFMDSAKPYLNPNLSIASLSKELLIPEKYLSQIINESFKQNFYDFINSYRIRESINLMRDQNNLGKTIIELMYEAGFNSKSTFNAVFKKQTNFTPSEYRKRTVSPSYN